MRSNSFRPYLILFSFPLHASLSRRTQSCCCSSHSLFQRQFQKISWTLMCASIHVCMAVCVWIQVSARVCACECKCVCVHVSLGVYENGSVFVCRGVYAHVCVSMHVSLCARVCVCMHVSVFTCVFSDESFGCCFKSNFSL